MTTPSANWNYPTTKLAAGLSAFRAGGHDGVVDFGGGFNGFLDAILALRAAVGVPATVAGLGVDGRYFDRIAAMAVVDLTAGGNPRPLTEAAARRLLDLASAGRIEID